MFLSRLTLQGFKSFANSVSLDFQPGITAIVGPNGSGKSNVAEAIRWALGEQSSKALRAKRSDDVIFAGSDKKSRLGVAEVSLYFNNEDNSAPVPYTELVLTRRVFRDGEGEYLINHQPTRLQDILLLLAQASFGQRTYSVIGQGMIDSFLLSSPPERKHLFDEAAGVRQYQMKKDQAVQKLSHAKENLVQGEALMAEIEPRLRSLTRQVRRLERRAEVEKELREKQEQYFGLLWQSLQHELNQLRGEHTTSDSRRSEIEKELAVIQSELEIMEQERTGSEVFAELQKKYNRILDEKNSLLQEQSVIRGRLEVAVKEAGRGEVVYHQQREQALKRSLDELQEEQEVTAQARHRAEAVLTREERERAIIDQHFKSLEKELVSLSQHLGIQALPDVQAAMRTWSKKFGQLVELFAAPAGTDTLQAKAEDLKKELVEILDRLEKIGQADQSTRLVAAQAEALHCMTERQTALEKVAAAQAEVQRQRDRLERQREEHAKLVAEFEKLQQESSIQELAKTNPEEAYAAIARQAKDLEQKVADLDEELKAAREEINNFNTLETTKKERLFSLQKSFRDTQQQLNHATTITNDLRVQLAKVEQRGADLRREIEQAMGADGNNRVQAAATKKLEGDIPLLAEAIGHLNHQLQLIGGIDQQITTEYHETNDRWEFLNGQAEDLRKAIVSLESAIKDLEGTIKKRFDVAFKKINEEFNQYFRTLFSGGKAELVLLQEVVQVKAASDEDEEDGEDDEVDPPAKGGSASGPKEKVITGIEIKATPPGKKLQSIAMLSGGEKALTSIALLCAIISNNPSPFVVLDEVDAALDEANSQRFAAILEHLAHKTQFITISHNRATMEKAKILYGVTMGDDGVSQLLSVKMEEVEDIIRRHGNR